MPSLFTNDQSKGPLYQYWKDRNTEEKALRDQRTQEAKLRGKGFTPLTPAYGPSSNESYQHRRASGPPSYATEARTDVTEEHDARGVAGEDLPAYVDTTASSHHAASGGENLLSASEEKARLQNYEARTQSDAAIAEALGREEAEAQAEEGQGKGKQPERRKSTIGKVGTWLADAATGYTKNQGRW